MLPRVVVMYLPQFYQNPENDVWWGEGFTDWVSARNAKPLFDGHYQPHIPLNDNYYDLLDRKTMEWQADLMHKYGVDGICMYHYWFKDGRKVLEKPAENLLEWKDIDMPFCFCWANEPWVRSWSSLVKGNVWVDSDHKIDNANASGVLLEQAYGSTDDWTEHFMYFLPFFQDDRYIKLDDKPVIVLYRSEDIFCLKDMLAAWKQLAVANGLKGLYVIGANSNEVTDDLLDGILVHEPQNTMGLLKQIGATSTEPYVISYDDTWETILGKNKKSEKTVFYGGFVGYDDTPRRGRRGTCIIGSSPQKFEDNLYSLLCKNDGSGASITFINAWNEWGEGMHLEPDSANGYNYLEAVKKAKEKYNTSFTTECKKLPESKEGNSFSSEMVSNLIEYNERISANIRAFDKWLSLYELGIHLAESIKEKSYGKIAVYGFGILGKHLYSQLLEAGVKVEYVIDKQPTKISDNLSAYSPDSNFEPVDTLIVTTSYFYNDISAAMSEKGFKRIISLESIIDECLGISSET